MIIMIVMSTVTTLNFNSVLLFQFSYKVYDMIYLNIQNVMEEAICSQLSIAKNVKMAIYSQLSLAQIR